VIDLRVYRERLGRVERAVEHTQGQVIDFTQARASRSAREREQAERQAQEQARAEREAQAREQAEREGQELTRSDHLSPEEATRVERLIAREPAWRAEQDAARIARLMERLENPEARIEALLQREQAWHAAQLEQARQQLEHATGQTHTFAQTARVAGRLVDRVELVGEDFGRVRDRANHLVLVPWTREMSQHLGRSVAIQLDAERHVTRVLAETPRRERDLGLDRGG
jgi:hypothetical protein